MHIGISKRIMNRIPFTADDILQRMNARIEKLVPAITAQRHIHIKIVIALFILIRVLQPEKLLDASSFESVAAYVAQMQAQEIEPGRSVVTLRDRKAIRNHLNSIHAVAPASSVRFASATAWIELR